MYTGTRIEITDSILIGGIISADDRSGNFYKTLVLQDSTAGITIRLDESGLYNNYMQGRHIYIKCKGLFLGAYNGLVQLGGAATVAGPAMGAVFLGLLSEILLLKFRYLYMLGLGVMLIVVVLALPAGLAGLLRRRPR